MTTIRPGPFAWPSTPTSSANPVHTSANPHLSRKRARSPSSSPEFGPDGDPLRDSTLGTRPHGYDISNQPRSDEDDEDIAEPLRKRIRHAPNPEQENARRDLEGMYLSDRVGGLGAATFPPRPSNIMDASQIYPPKPSVAHPTFPAWSDQPDFFPQQPNSNNDDGDLPIFDASIPILQAQSVHQPDSSSDVEAGTSVQMGAGGQWRNHERERRLDGDADMMMDDDGFRDNGPRGDVSPSPSGAGNGPVVEEIIDEDENVGLRSGWDQSAQSAKGKGREKRLYSDYDPEKDRIIVTSLSDTETSPPSSPRSSYAPSPTTSTPPGFFSAPIDLSDSALSTDGIINLPPSSIRNMPLAQPGAKGFTISPSLLSRLNDWQSNHPDQYLAELTRRRAREKDKRGLVVYRHPSAFFGARESNAGTGDGMDSDPEDAVDDGRIDLGMGATIEEIEDEAEEGASMMDMDSDDVNVTGTGVLPGLTSEVESMDIE